MSIQIWKTKNTEFENEKIINSINKKNHIGTKLLDLKKEKYSIFERFIYDTAMYHFKRLNIEVTEKNYVEFWCKNTFDTHKLHVDCDENEKKTNMNYIYPLLSCVTYFNNNLCPTILTNVDLESYQYKEFESQTELFLSFPKCNKQITFNGKFYHGSGLLSENNENDNRYIIAINLWNIKPSNIDYYINDEEETTPEFVVIEEDQHIENIVVGEEVINPALFENILYNNDKMALYVFNKFTNINASSDTSTYNFALENKSQPSNKKEETLNLKKKDKFENIMSDINEIMNKKIDLKYNRFLQRFNYTNIYTPDVCRYIINESEKYAAKNGGWTKKRHNNYPTTDLPVDIIPTIFGLVLETLTSIVDKIKKSYRLTENIFIDVSDLFVVKYKDDEQNHLEMHEDGSFISFNILLSNTKDFEGGGTYFDDGLSSYLEQGDMLVHSSRMKHAGLPVTKGTRYILVGFLNLNVKVYNQTDSSSQIDNTSQIDAGYCALNFK